MLSHHISHLFSHFASEKAQHANLDNRTAEHNNTSQTLNISRQLSISDQSIEAIASPNENI